MNIHHLELFYYVAKHGGVSAAARRIPYGIQQPAISAQIIQLENDLGAALFTRRPFKLTKAGTELFRFIEPFFSGLDGIALKLRGSVERSIRIGAVETVQQKYLPRLLKNICRRFPSLNFTLLPAGPEEIERGLLCQEIDLGIAPLLGKRPEGIKQKEMLRVPMALVVPEKCSVKSPEDLWNEDRIAESLITVSEDDSVCRLFQAELQKRKIDWFPSIQVNSQELITRYATEGFGIGLILFEPGFPAPAGVRVLPLSDFPSVPYGLLWTGVLSPLQSAILAEAQALADSLSAECAVKGGMEGKKRGTADGRGRTRMREGAGALERTKGTEGT
jgi:DNA-binding transcriptional LysR family regulator